MNVLFLDDCETRTKMFRRMCPCAKLTETAQDCIDALGKLAEGEHFDLVCLDHDLGGEVYVDSSRSDTGAEVARWLAANKTPIERILVHTLNTDAGRAMTRMLKEAGYSAYYSPFIKDRYWEQVARYSKDSAA